MVKSESVGIWAFYIGLVVTLIVAIISPSVTYDATLLGIVAILGIIVGLLNIEDKEIMTFLVASIALLLSAGSLVTLASFIPFIGEVTVNFLQGLVVFVAPGAAIVSIKAFYNVAKRK